MATNREIKLKIKWFYIRVLGIQKKFRRYFENNKIRMRIMNDLFQKLRETMLHDCIMNQKDKKCTKH